jgi:multidrug efflux system outer membrane protein
MRLDHFGHNYEFSVNARSALCRKQWKLALLRYNAGRASYLEVLEAEQLLFPAEDALAQTQRDQLLVVVSLYKALGGVWNLGDAQWTQPR